MKPSFSCTWPRMVSPADSSPPMAIGVAHAFESNVWMQKAGDGVPEGNRACDTEGASYAGTEPICAYGPDDRIRSQ